MRPYIIQNYQVLEKLNSGGYGGIYKVKDINTGRILALKVQMTSNESKREVEILNKLTAKNFKGFPKLIDQGFLRNGQKHYFITNFLRENLLDFMLSGPCQTTSFKNIKSLTISQTVTIGIKLVEQIKYLHSLGYVHCDIKPNNLMFSNSFSKKDFEEERNLDKIEIFIIDFGLAQTFIDSQRNIQYQTKSNHIKGNMHFNSKNQMNSLTSCRKDDLESIFYNLIFMLTGNMPWGVEQDRYSKEEIQNFKLNLFSLPMCSNLPGNFYIIYKYILSLEFTDDPNYQFIIDQLKCCLKDVPEQYSYQINPNNKKISESAYQKQSTPVKLINNNENQQAQYQSVSNQRFTFNLIRIGDIDHINAVDINQLEEEKAQTAYNQQTPDKDIQQFIDFQKEIEELEDDFEDEIPQMKLEEGTLPHYLFGYLKQPKVNCVQSLQQDTIKTKTQ